MSSRWSGKRVLGAVVVLPAALVAMSLLSGCGADSYPEDLTYPLREDPVIFKLPAESPKRLDTPGRWNQLFDEITAQGGEIKQALGNMELVPAAQRGALGKYRNDLKAQLDKYFGTPAKPKVAGIQEVQDAEDLKLGEATLAEGSRLYRQHCLHCHGLTGDGRGPTGLWVNPHPRDYRLGMFKFTSSALGAGSRKARREDLVRVLREGIDGSSMPSFGQLPAEHLESLASYVIHLSIRGETELLVLKSLLENPEEPNLGGSGFNQYFKETIELVAKRWVDTAKDPIKPGPYKVDDANKDELEKSIVNGYLLFRGNKAGCLGCHVSYGRQREYKWDDWGTISRPADLTSGVYRGGRRPLDLYYRIHSGIAGTKMSEAYPGALTEDEIWNVVDFVKALPYPEQLPPAIRKEIYPDR